MIHNNDNRNSLAFSATAKVLRPLIRMLIHWGIGFKEFMEIVKGVYLSESSSVLKEEDKEITSSALSIISGIHRKDTSLYMKSNPDKNEAPFKKYSAGASAAMAVVSEWISNSLYTDEGNKPIPLYYLDKTSDNKNFTALSRTITQDIRSKTILEELLRLDLVEYREDIVYLKDEAFIPHTGYVEKLEFFSKNISEHLAAASKNVQSDKPRFFERSAFHDELSKEDVREIDSFVRDEGMELLKKTYRMAEDLSRKNKLLKSPLQKKTNSVTLGVFLHYEESDKEK